MPTDEGDELVPFGWEPDEYLATLSEAQVARARLVAATQDRRLGDAARLLGERAPVMGANNLTGERAA